MTDATVTVSPITITTYVTYYSVTTTESTTLMLTAPIHSTFSINESTIETSSGSTVLLLYTISMTSMVNELDNIESLTALSYIIRPSLGNNTRETVSVVEDQKIDIVKADRDVVLSVVGSYISSNNNLDLLSDSAKKSFYNKVSKTVKNRQSAQYVIRSSVNNYRR